MSKVRQMIYDELEGLFGEYYIDYDKENFRKNYADFVDGVIDNNHLEEGDDIEDSVYFMVRGDLLVFLRNMSE